MNGLTETTPALDLRHVSRTYDRHGAVYALRDVSLSIAQATRVAIMGPSGSGKSTLLNLMGGLDVPTSGEVFVGPRNLAAMSEADRAVLRRTQIAYVFQAYHLLPTLSCADNVALPLHLAGIHRRDVAARVERALDDVGLTPRARHLPDELSGGERQRTAIARALVIEPRVVLADEPTGNLDSANGHHVLTLLCAITMARAAALVLVTHDEDSARRCDRVVRLHDGAIASDSVGAR